MKQVVNISLDTARNDFEFETEFLGQDFMIRRIGTDGNMEKAVELMKEWETKADAIALGGIKYPPGIGSKSAIKSQQVKLEKLGEQLRIPVTTGMNLRNVAFEWAIRHLDFKLGNYFSNARVLFLSGINNYRMATVMAEMTDNITFADPIYENGISKFLNSVEDLEKYAKGAHEVLKWVPTKRLAKSVMPVKSWNDYILKKAMQKATVIVIPYQGFYDYIKLGGLAEFGGKTIITATAYADRIQALKEKGAYVVIDTTPNVLDRVVGVPVIEALILSALEKKQNQITGNELLEVISTQRMDPRVVYPQGESRRINRFAFVIHPLSKEYLKKDKAVDLISKVTPPQFMDAVEKIVAYSPPWIYSQVSGIKSPQGVEAEGWLITVGGTPKQMLSHDPEFTYTRLLQAAKMAKRLGAQIMGLGAFTKVVGDAGVTVARKAELPITTGNSYSASGALWAAADAVRRMGLIEVEKGQKIKAKSMVFGATGAIGSVCCRLLAKAFEEVYMCGRNMAKLMALKESILRETEDVTVHMVVNPDKYLPDMDVIVTATSGAGKSILDITRVKPGCIITDVARPLDLSPEDVAKRPDVLVIESGEIELPGDPKMKSIGLPPKVVFACMAETIVLALEGRYETFTVGRNIEWEKVREIYKMGLKHGMKLAAISGVNGVFTDDDIARVRDLALKARSEKK